MTTLTVTMADRGRALQSTPGTLTGLRFMIATLYHSCNFTLVYDALTGWSPRALLNLDVSTAMVTIPNPIHSHALLADGAVLGGERKTYDPRLSPAHHGERIAAMPDKIRNGRNMREGYMRGCGLQFGNVRALCESDPLYRRAFDFAKARTMISQLNLMNFFMILALSFRKLPSGHIAEFGTARGGSAIFLAVVADALFPGTKVYAFDSFAGMPEVDTSRDAHKSGDFSEASDTELVRYCSEVGINNLVPVKGPFSETIKRVLPTIGPLRLAHIDCDLYASVAEAYDGVKPFIVPGGYIAFDDPLHSSCLGAFEAVEELLVRRDGLHAEQAYPHLVYRAPLVGSTLMSRPESNSGLMRANASPGANH
jgi:hypothetical protein